MKTKLLALASLAISLVCSARAQVTETYTTSPGAAIPDGTGGTLTSTITVSGSAISTIQNVNVLLNIAPIAGAPDPGVTQNNGWAGDLIVTLNHLTATSVLLNRPGYDVANGIDRPTPPNPVDVNITE